MMTFEYGSVIQSSSNFIICSIVTKLFFSTKPSLLFIIQLKTKHELFQIAALHTFDPPHIWLYISTCLPLRYGLCIFMKRGIFWCLLPTYDLLSSIIFSDYAKQRRIWWEHFTLYLLTPLSKYTYNSKQHTINNCITDNKRK